MVKEPADHRGWIKATDRDFGRVIRIEASNESGVCKCVTCDHHGFWDGGMHAGHFRGKRNSVRYLEMGVHPQCATCNVTGVAHSVAYSRQKIEAVAHAYLRYMLDRYGKRGVDAFYILEAQSINLLEADLRVKRHWYKWRLKVALRERGL